MVDKNASLRIPDAEFAARIAAVKGRMKQGNIDLLVLYSNALDPGHVRYLADVVGVNESAAMVIPLEGDPIVCSGQACQAWSKYKSRVKDVRIFPEVGEVAGTEYLVGDQFTFSSLFQELRQKYSIKKIGTVGTLIFPQIIYVQLQKTFPAAEIVNAESLMFELRVRKSENEVACTRRAAEILDNSFANAVQKIQVGWDGARHHGGDRRCNTSRGSGRHSRQLGPHDPNRCRALQPVHEPEHATKSERRRDHLPAGRCSGGRVQLRPLYALCFR